MCNFKFKLHLCLVLLFFLFVYETGKVENKDSSSAAQSPTSEKLLKRHQRDHTASIDPHSSRD